MIAMRVVIALEGFECRRQTKSRNAVIVWFNFCVETEEKLVLWDALLHNLHLALFLFTRTTSKTLITTYPALCLLNVKRKSFRAFMLHNLYQKSILLKLNNENVVRVWLDSEMHARNFFFTQHKLKSMIWSFDAPRADMPLMRKKARSYGYVRFEATSN